MVAKIATNLRFFRILFIWLVGMMGAGRVIMTLGMTSVSVAEDLVHLQMTAAQIAAINPHLVPLIAHDRAGFSGGLICAGTMVALVFRDCYGDNCYGDNHATSSNA